ncbi:hypothetical protein DFJ73DRAFT_917476 [Zopfochytrium polystomum]|nr:hypothetical protein DFJ73DRAFT_917476 [Zopfochytrium polystomum]
MAYYDTSNGTQRLPQAATAAYARQNAHQERQLMDDRKEEQPNFPDNQKADFPTAAAAVAGGWEHDRERKQQRPRAAESNIFSAVGSKPMDPVPPGWSNEPPPRRRNAFVTVLTDYLCCCIPRSKNGRIVCGVVTGVLLAGLAVVGYFFYPRFPAIQVLSISKDGANAFEFVQDPQYPKNFNKVTYRMRLAMNVSVYNSNLYDLHVDLIDLQAYLMVNTSAIKAEGVSPATLGLEKYIGPAPSNPDPSYVASTTPQVGTATTTTRLTFPARANTTFQMSFQFAYAPDPVVGLVKDPAFAELVNVCGRLGVARPALLAYAARTDVAGIKRVGVRPVVGGEIRVRCPASKAQLALLEAAVKSGEDVEQALKDAFNGDGGDGGNATAATGAGAAKADGFSGQEIAKLVAVMATGGSSSGGGGGGGGNDDDDGRGNLLAEGQEHRYLRAAAADAPPSWVSR